MGRGGLWIEEGIPCEKATVTMELSAELYRFSLNLDTRCQGALQRTKLKGTWDWKGESKLLLRFPNKGQKDSHLQCDIDPRTSEETEHAVHCKLDEELEFRLRAKQR